MQKVSVTAFIHANGKTLVVRRSADDDFLAGYYELPGGKVDFAEDPRLALKRELEEELGLKNCRVLSPYDLFSYVSADGIKQTVDIQFIVKAEDGAAIRLSAEHDDYRWIGREELDNFRFSAEMKNAIAKGFDILMGLDASAEEKS